VQNTDGAGNDYGYDANANVTSSSPKSINTITYDSFTQRPTSVSMSSGASLTLEYGGDTQRVLKNYTSGGSTNSKLYLHGQSDYPLIEKNKTSAAAETLAIYIYGLNGTVAKRVGSTVLFLLKDHLGSTRVVMDGTGLVRTYYDYDALGNVIRIGTTNEVKYQFTGQEYDESGLHNYRARLYDSDLGKFYAIDPAEQGWSPFVYAGNNPVILVDPEGRFWVPILIGIGANLLANIDKLDSGEWYKNPLKTLGFAAIGAATGYLAGFGGGSFLNNVAWGAATGAFQGAGNAWVSGASPSTIWRKTYQGAILGGSIAALHSFAEYQRNLDEYGHFKSNDGTLQELIDAGTDESSRMRAIEFVQKRYDLAGYKGMDFYYEADLDVITGVEGVLGTTEPSGKIYLSELAFRSPNQLKETMLHEVGHRLHDITLDDFGNRIRIEYPNTEEFLFGHGWNADNTVARYSGKLHIGRQASQYSRFLQWYFAIGRRW
jgi:RHS repeat-associated protein